MKEDKKIISADFINHNTPIQNINDPIIKASAVKLFIKREDLNHSQLSGNKWHKLKYNLIAASDKGYNTLLSFGGSYSNHIYAVAAAGKLFGYKTIGIIRGEEHKPLNPVLSFASASGMQLHYMDRKTYRNKSNPDIINSLQKRFGDFYLIPEGGTNDLAVKGISEIILNLKEKYDYICCACGTGGTLAGLIAGLDGKNNALGFSVLKNGNFLINDVADFVYSMNGTRYNNWDINFDYHFGGYAKTKSELLEFIERFRNVNNIPIEPVYTGKLFYGLYDLIITGYFKSGDTILAIHTGGLQGLNGMKNHFTKMRNRENIK